MYIKHYTRSLSIHGNKETIKMDRSKLIFVLRTVKGIQLALCFRGYTYGNNEFSIVLQLSYMPIWCCKTCNALSAVDCKWKPLTHSAGPISVRFDFKEMSQRKCTEG